MKIKQFKSIEQLENSLVRDIVKIITDSIENYENREYYFLEVQLP